MKEKISSLNFEKAMRSVPMDTACYAGFMNATLEYIFRIERDVRGFVEMVTCLSWIQAENNILYRVARVCVKKKSKTQYFYVLAEGDTQSEGKWLVIGRSHFFDNKERVPDLRTEMTWYESS